MSTPNNSTVKIGILQGSARTKNNGAGIADWVKTHIEQQIPHSTAIVIDPTSDIHPKGFLTDATIPAVRTSSDQYVNKDTQVWSEFVYSLNALIVVTPQYNWGYPASIKLAIDCLSNEWRDIPVLLVTYGGRGGSQVGEQLRSVVGQGIKALLTPNNVEVSLPAEYIRTELRVQPGTAPEFLQQFDTALKTGIQELQQIISTTPRQITPTTKVVN